MAGRHVRGRRRTDRAGPAGRAAGDGARGRRPAAGGLRGLRDAVRPSRPVAAACRVGLGRPRAVRRTRRARLGTTAGGRGVVRADGRIPGGSGGARRARSSAPLGTARLPAAVPRAAVAAPRACGRAAVLAGALGVLYLAAVGAGCGDRRSRRSRRPFSCCSSSSSCSCRGAVRHRRSPAPHQIERHNNQGLIKHRARTPGGTVVRPQATPRERSTAEPVPGQESPDAPAPDGPEPSEAPDTPAAPDERHGRERAVPREAGTPDEGPGPRDADTAHEGPAPRTSQESATGTPQEDVSPRPHASRPPGPRARPVPPPPIPSRPPPPRHRR